MKGSSPLAAPVVFMHVLGLFCRALAMKIGARIHIYHEKYQITCKIHTLRLFLHGLFLQCLSSFSFFDIMFMSFLLNAFESTVPVNQPKFVQCKVLRGVLIY